MAEAGTGNPTQVESDTAHGSWRCLQFPALAAMGRAKKAEVGAQVPVEHKAGRSGVRAVILESRPVLNTLPEGAGVHFCLPCRPLFSS